MFSAGMLISIRSMSDAAEREVFVSMASFVSEIDFASEVVYGSGNSGSGSMYPCAIRKGFKVSSAMESSV